MTAPARPDAGDALRAEHDRLAESLATRRSVEHVRRGAYLAFAAFLAGGVAVRLAHDRWFSAPAARPAGAPAYFYAALAVTAALVALAAQQALRARALMRDEDARFARLQALRRELELDP